MMIVCLVGETLDAAFGEEGDSEEEDAIVNQVLDEIGISFNEKVCFYRLIYLVFEDICV
jgi:hypothetical protein